jgi:hypothetical protein
MSTPKTDGPGTGRFSPLERRALLTLISLIRDREHDEDEWTCTDIPLRALYERMWVMIPDQSYELQRRNQRQAIRRALGRLHERGLINAIALGWCEVRDAEWIRWQGGGSRKRYYEYGGGREGTPRWRMVGLNELGIRIALQLAKENNEMSIGNEFDGAGKRC